MSGRSKLLLRAMLISNYLWVFFFPLGHWVGPRKQRKGRRREGRAGSGRAEMLQAAKCLRERGAVLTLCCPLAGAARLGSPRNPGGPGGKCRRRQSRLLLAVLAEGEIEIRFMPNGAVPTSSQNNLGLPIGAYELLAHLFKEHQHSVQS